MLLVVLAVMLYINQATSMSKCYQRICDKETSIIICKQSLILIFDVTNYNMERDHEALSAVKSACMGRESCDPSTVCSKSSQGKLLINYVCEEANVYTSSCINVFKINHPHGFIQSPNYPETFRKHMPCRWRIRPPNDSLVVLKLHYITINGPVDECDGGLTVSGLDCDAMASNAPRVLCGRDNDTSVVRCGKVNIELTYSQKVYPLRFWLEFRVIKQSTANVLSSGLTCSGLTRSTNTVSTDNSAMVSKETDTELLIILLSVISSLSGTLIIVLVIVCIRCRLLRMSVSDHVFCEPSPALQAHYDYISSLETDKPHPELADEYFEVADALPYSLRATPASPAYAEVEQFIDFKRGPQSSLDSMEWADCQSQYSNMDGTAASETARPPESPGGVKRNKQCAEGRTKSFMNKHKLPKISGSPKNKIKIGKFSRSHSTTEPKVFIVNLDNNTQETSLCDDTSAYEQIEVQQGLDGVRVVMSDSKIQANGQETDQSETGKPADRIKWTPQSSRRKNPSHSHKSRVDQIKEGLLSKHSDKKDENSSKTKELRLQKVPNLHNDKNSRPMSPEKRHKTYVDGTGKKSNENLENSELRKSQKPLLLKDRLQTSGIVRNGIQKFEKS